jgi:hypothetical protein
VGLTVHTDQIARNYKNNPYRSSLPRVESWSAAEAPTHIHLPPAYWQQLTSRQIRALEGLQLYSGNSSNNLAFVESFKRLLELNQYRVSTTREKVPLTTIVELHDAYQRDGLYIDIQRDWLFLLDQTSVSWHPCPWVKTKAWMLQQIRNDWRSVLTLTRRIGLKSIVQLALLRSNNLASRAECLVHD